MLKQVIFAFILGISSLTFSQPNEVVNAKMAYEQHDFLTAKDHIEKAILHEKTAKKSSTWMLRGDIYQQLIFHSDKTVRNAVKNASRLAFESYQKAATIDNKTSRSQINSKCEFVNNLALNNGVEHFNDGNYDRAKSEFEVSVEVAEWLGKTDSLALFNVGLACQGLKDYDCAINMFKRCKELNYLRENCYESLGYCYQFKEDYAGAVSILEEGLTYYPKNNEMHTTLLNIFLFNGEDEKALNIIDNLLREYPSHAPYYSVKGSVLSNLERSEEAISVLENGLLLDPESFDIRFNLGSLYFNKGADIMMKANEEDDNTKSEKLLNEATSEFETAKKHFEKALELRPDDRGTMYGLKNVYAYTNDFEKFEEIKRKLSEN